MSQPISASAIEPRSITRERKSAVQTTPATAAQTSREASLQQRQQQMHSVMLAAVVCEEAARTEHRVTKPVA